MVPTLILLLFVAGVVVAKVHIERASLDATDIEATRRRRDSLFRQFFPARMAVTGALLIFGGLAAGRFNIYPILQPMMSSIGFYLLVLTVFVYLARRNRFRDEVFKRQCRVCPVCLYALDGLRESGQCPECGEEFDGVTLRKRWM